MEYTETLNYYEDITKPLDCDKKVVEGNLFRRAHTDGLRTDRVEYPYRIEWDNESESDEDTGLHNDSDGEHEIRIMDNLTDGNATDLTGPDAHRQTILQPDILHIESEEVKPDEDISPSQNWKLLQRPAVPNSYKQGNPTSTGLYAPNGKWKGDINDERIQRLHTEYMKSYLTDEYKQNYSPAASKKK